MTYYRTFLVLLFFSVEVSSKSLDCECALWNSTVETPLKAVCGSDGHTYNNTCHLTCSSENVTVAYDGACCPRILCSPTVKPICDNMGHTHINECVFNRIRCLTQKMLLVDIEKSHDGTCSKTELNDENCEDICVQGGDPVCDDHGITHQDECTFEKFNCLNRNNGTDEHFIMFYSECRNSSAEGSGELLDMLFTSTLIEDSNNKPTRTRKTKEIHDHRESLAKNRLHVQSPSYYYNYDEETFPPIDDDFFGSGEEFNAADAGVLLTLETQENDYVNDGINGTDSDEQNVVSTSNVQPFDLTVPCSAAGCNKSSSPVCDNRNKTHRNLCLFKFYACKINRIDGTVVEISHKGECTDKASQCSSCSVDEPKISVCDNLNKTYPSICEFNRKNCLRKANVEPEAQRILVSIGRCHRRSPVFKEDEESCPRLCSHRTKPVCDNMNKTHKNLCKFQQMNCRLRKQGKSAPELRYLRSCTDGENGEEEHRNENSIEEGSGDFSITTSAATTTAAEISSSEEKTGESMAVDGMDKQTESDFDCPEPTCESHGGLPICDSLGNVHSNICLFTFARCKAAQNGRSLTVAPIEHCLDGDCKKVQNCSLSESFPICGSDFVTYPDICNLQQQRCIDGKVDVLFTGKCSDCFEEPCPLLSSSDSDSLFVCDQEGVSRSLCEYNMLACIVEKSYNTNLGIQHLGRCCEPKEPCDTQDPEPMCGSDGRIYENPCQLNVENCRNEKLELPIVTVADKETCESTEDGNIKKETENAEGDDTKNAIITPNQEEKKIEEKEDCPDRCNNTYVPVCGTDDTTYTNLCVLQTVRCKLGKNVHVAYKGDCCNQQCTNTFDPVCDNRGITHQNLCLFGKERCIAERTTGNHLSIKKFAVCDSSEVCNTECPNTYEPICVSNGETLVNTCEMEKLNCFLANNITQGMIVKKEYDGECCNKVPCDFAFAPVCDTSGKTHANDCIFRQAACIQSNKYNKKLKIAYKGQCCNQPCSNEKNPVCDGTKTHLNICKLRIEQCKAERMGEILSLSYLGECCALPEGECSKSGSLCDSDGQTHQNLCHFHQKRCVVEKTLNKTLTAIHSGECCVIETCHKDLKAVCDNRGGTHASLCHFQNTKCIHDKIHPHNTINLAYEGSCCSSSCESDWNIVCDQHGSVYRNKCFFKLRDCEQRKKRSGALLETPCPGRRARRTLLRRRKSHP